MLSYLELSIDLTKNYQTINEVVFLWSKFCDVSESIHQNVGWSDVCNHRGIYNSVSKNKAWLNNKL